MMAKRTSGRRKGSSSSARKSAKGRRSIKRSKAGTKTRRSKVKSKRKAAGRAKRPVKAAARQPAKVARKSRRTPAKPLSDKRPRLDRKRRTLDEIVPTPPSSLDMNRRGSAVRSGRAALNDSLQEHTGMTPEL